MVVIILTDHAKYRLLERGISAHEVKKIAKNGQTIKVEANGIMIKMGMYNDQQLSVVIKKYSNKIIILTLYYENYV